MTDWKVPESAPRVSRERIRQFLDSYGSIEFRHRAEVVPIMQRDDPDESRIVAHDSKLDERLREIYRIRAKTTALSPHSPNYPIGLADDVRDLVTQLVIPPFQN